MTMPLHTFSSPAGSDESARLPATATNILQLIHTDVITVPGKFNTCICKYYFNMRDSGMVHMYVSYRSRYSRVHMDCVGHSSCIHMPTLPIKCQMACNPAVL